MGYDAVWGMKHVLQKFLVARQQCRSQVYSICWFVLQECEIILWQARWLSITMHRLGMPEGANWGDAKWWGDRRLKYSKALEQPIECYWRHGKFYFCKFQSCKMGVFWLIIVWGFLVYLNLLICHEWEKDQLWGCYGRQMILGCMQEQLLYSLLLRPRHTWLTTPAESRWHIAWALTVKLEVVHDIHSR